MRFLRREIKQRLCQAGALGSTSAGGLAGCWEQQGKMHGYFYFNI